MYRITAIIMNIIISTTSMFCSVFVPTLPYLPPADVQILDVLHNAYGLTIPQIDNAEKRLETYWNAYRAIMGSAFDTFRADMQDVIDNAKTSRKITLSVSTQHTIRHLLAEALENGYEYNESEDPPATPSQTEVTVTYTEFNDRMKQVMGYSWDLNQNVWNGIVTTFQQHPNYKLACSKMGSSTRYYVLMNADMYLDANGHIVLPTRSVAIYADNNYSSTVNAQTLNFSGDTYFNSLEQFNARFMPDTVQKKYINAISTNVESAIQSETIIPITAETEITNGVIDETKPVVISLPNNMPTPATTVTELQGVLDDIGVVPISENPAQTVTQLREEVAAKYGDTSDYALDLTRYFPFCLPFDIARILQAFVAEPEAPKFSYTIENPFSDDEEDNIVLEIDLAMFDEVASILRTLESILFVVGLAAVTRSLYLRG